MDGKLESLLLGMGGEAVERGPAPVARLAGEGHPFATDGLVELGRPERWAFRNAVRLWRDCSGMANDGDGLMQLCVGYALSGGVWRRHCWCVWHALGRPAVVEPGLAKERYHGLVLVGEEADGLFYEHK